MKDSTKIWSKILGAKFYFLNLDMLAEVYICMLVSLES